MLKDLTNRNQDDLKTQAVMQRTKENNTSVKIMTMMMIMLTTVYTYIALIICRELRSLYTITILLSKQAYKVGIDIIIISGLRKPKRKGGKGLEHQTV